MTGIKKPDETAQKAAEAYRKALEGLGEAAKLSKQAQDYQKRSADVAREVEATKEALKKRRNQPPPVPPGGDDLAELNRELATLREQLAQRKDDPQFQQWDPTQRTELTKALTTQTAETKNELAAVEKELAAEPPQDQPETLTKARTDELQARKQLLEARQKAVAAQLALMQVQNEAGLSRLKHELNQLQTARLEKEIELYQERINALRTRQAATRVDEAEALLKNAPPVLKEQAEKNLELARLAQSLVEKNAAAVEARDGVKAQLEKLENELEATRKRVQTIGLTGPIGIKLRRQRKDLPNMAELREEVRAREREYEELSWEQVELQEEIPDPSTVEQQIERVLDRTGDLDAAQYEQLKERAQQVFDDLRENYGAVNSRYDSYLATLIEVSTFQQQLLEKTQEFAQYIDQRVLWIPSSRPIGLDDVERGLGSLRWLADPARWRQVGPALGQDVRRNLFLYLASLLVFGSLFYFGRRMRMQLAELGRQVRQKGFHRLAPTFQAALLTVLIAVHWPAMLWFVGWRLDAAETAGAFTQQVALALQWSAVVYFGMELMRQICRNRGLAEAHFNWPGSAVVLLRFHLRWLTLAGLPLLFVTAVLHAEEYDSGLDVLERLFFTTAMVVLAVFAQRVMRPRGGVFRDLIAYHPGGWTDRLRYVWFSLAILAPLVLAGLALAGWYYTARHLAWRLQATVWLLLGLVLVRAFLTRWILVHRRRLSIEQMREKRAVQEAAEASDVSGDGQPAPATSSPPPPPNAELADLAALSSQTQRLFVTGLIVAGLVGLWLIWVDIFPALSFLDRWPLWTTDELAVTASHLALAILIFVLTVVAARNLPGLLEISLLQRLPLDAAVRFAITTLASYVIVIVGIVVAANQIGIGWDQVQWLAAALTLGLGFGLQEVFANFVCGIIILFERPIRVGDLVTIGDVTGQVTRIRIRATTLRNWDRQELVVPNKEFITGRVLNWTLSDQVNRVVLTVGVAYGSDTERAREILDKIVRAHPRVVEQPSPVVTFQEFGDSTLNFVIRACIPSIDYRLAVIHELNTEIHRRFAEAGIEIAFPQRDLHVRSIPESLTHPLLRETPVPVTHGNGDDARA